MTTSIVSTALVSAIAMACVFGEVQRACVDAWGPRMGVILFKRAYFVASTTCHLWGVPDGYYPSDVPPFGSSHFVDCSPTTTVLIFASGLAYHGVSTLKWRPSSHEGFEWGVHHAATMVLLFTALFTPALHRASMYVMLIHDVVDIFVYSTMRSIAAYGESEGTILHAVALICAAAYLRVYTLGLIVYDLCQQQQQQQQHQPRFVADFAKTHVHTTLVCAAVVLWCVHIYWLFKMVQRVATAAMRHARPCTPPRNVAATSPIRRDVASSPTTPCIADTA
jgi:hypothetical protein